MIKMLSAATALTAAALVLAGPAAAAEKISLGISGKMEQWVGFAEQDDSFETAAGRDYASFDTKADTELYFRGSTKLDNGITVAARIELEGDQSTGRTIDESFMSVSGSFGEIVLGEHENPLWAEHSASPDVGIKNQDGDYDDWVITPTGFSDQKVTGWDQDGKTSKVTYISPRFAGLSLAGSYTPDVTNQDETQPNHGAPSQNGYVVGVLYDNEFNGVGITADAAYGALGEGSSTSEDLDGWHLGLNVNYAGFVFGGSYFTMDEDEIAGATASLDTVAYDVGVSYGWGPYAVSLTWLHSEVEGATATAAEDKKDSVMVSGRYAMGPGVSLRGSVFHADYDGETSGNANNNDGWGAVAGFALSF